MFPINKAQQYPHLTAYLNYLARQTRQSQTLDPRNLIVPGLTAGTSLIAMGGHSWFVAAMCLAVGTASLLIHPVTKSRSNTPQHERMLLAQSIGQKMRLMQERRRLHRDLDPTSLSVLEECARSWSRARTALNSGSWGTGGLPERYVSLRAQASEAIDHAMEDVLVLFQDLVPHSVEARSAIDYVEEAIETFVLKEPVSRAAPNAAWNARQTAEKLRGLAEEAERMGAMVAQDLPAEDVVGGLDFALGEMRVIREAEEELRH